MPIAAPRCCGGKTWNITTIASGWTIPAAKPWRMRETTSTVWSGATPPTMEPNRNSARAPIIVNRCPNARSHQAVISMVTVMAARKPVDSHWA